MSDLIPGDNEVDTYGQALVHQVIAPLGWERSVFHPWLWIRWIRGERVSIALHFYDSQEGWIQLATRAWNDPTTEKILQDSQTTQKFHLSDPDILEKIRAWVEQAE